MANNQISEKDITVPFDVPKKARREFIRNYLKITKGTGNLMLFAGDQKIEHLNNDFYGQNISKDDASPKHLFEIASKAKIGCFASQMGLIARYGPEYKNIPFLIKLNSKTNLLKTAEKDPLSRAIYTVDNVVEFKKNSGLNILGVGYTIYIGSRYEHIMLAEAAQIINKAHKNGLIAVIWAYPRGKAVKNEKDPHLIAGAAGVAACLGADFVKLNEPDTENPIEELKEAVLAAGNTKVVCAGGESVDPKIFLENLYKQIHIAGTAGNGTGRNIHQKPLGQAIRMANAIYAVSVEGKNAQEALEIYRGEIKT
ncbi:aldolase [bacterium]|nr:aldolase [bacterium]